MPKTKKQAPVAPVVVEAPKPTFDRAFDQIFSHVESLMNKSESAVEEFQRRIAEGKIEDTIQWCAKSAIKGEYCLKDMKRFMQTLLPTTVPASLEAHARDMHERFSKFVQMEMYHLVGDDSGWMSCEMPEPNSTNPYSNLGDLYRHNAKLTVMNVAKYIVYRLKEVIVLTDEGKKREDGF